MQIVFSYTPKNLASWLIRKLTKSKVSHVSLRFGGEDRNWMAEATAKGVQPGWWNTFLKHNKVVYVFEYQSSNEQVLNQVVDECMDDMIGKHYDFLALIGFALHILFQSLGFKSRRNLLGSAKSYVCSEFIMRVFGRVTDHLGTLVLDGDPELTTPEDLYQKCKANPAFVGQVP